MADTILVTDVGLGVYNNRLKNGDTGAAEPHHAGWGTGTTTAAATDTTLETEGAEARIVSTTSIETTTATDDTYQAIALMACNATPKAITEVGLLDAATSGKLFIRGTFSPINVGDGDSIQFTIKSVSAQG